MRQAVDCFESWRYGAFVHWGPLAGYGKARYVDRETHDELAAGFEARATGFDATAWVDAFIQRGFRYLTFVPKHGYDYCLWPTKVRTGHSRRDFVAEIAAACRERDFPLLLYMNLNAGGFAELAEAGFPAWQTVVRAQHKILGQWFSEYITRYRPAGIWLDAWPCSRVACEKAGLDPRQVFDFDALLNPVRDAGPEILILNKERLTENVDVLTSEYHFKDHFGSPLDISQGPIETCDALPGSQWFASRRTDEAFLDEATIAAQADIYIKRLVCSVGRGINYLLDTGPLPDGRLQRVEMDILSRIGSWLKVHGEAVYDTRHLDVGPTPWGYAVRKGSRVFLHLLDNRDIHAALDCTEHGHSVPEKEMRTGLPADRRIAVRAWGASEVVARRLPSGDPVPVDRAGDRWILDCSTVEPDAVDTVVELDEV